MVGAQPRDRATGATRLVMALLFLLAAAGCKDDPPPPAPAAAAASATAAATPVPIPLYLDDERVAATLLPAGRASLGELLPAPFRSASSWRHVSATTPDGRELSLREFAQKYPRHDVRVWVDDGQVVVGVFAEVPTSAPKRVKDRLRDPKFSLAGIDRISVRTTPPKREAPSLSLTVTVGDERVRLDGDALAALPLESTGKRHEGRRRGRQGWRVQAVVARAFPGKVVQRVVVVSDGPEIALDRAALADDAHPALLRLTRRGVLNFSVWSRDDNERTKRARRVRELRVQVAK